jgi:signal transduction histidine kinase
VSLRVRLFVLFGALLVLLGGAELLLVGSLTQRLSANVDEVAGAVGKRLVRFMGNGLPPLPSPGHAAPSGVGAPKADTHVFVYTSESHSTTASGAPHVETEVRVETDDVSRLPSGKVMRVLRLRGPQLDTTIPIPEAGLGSTLGSFRQQLLLGSLGILGLGLLVAAVVADRVSSPLHELARAARRVGEGDLGARVPVSAGGEVGEAIESFNRMSERLAALEREALHSRDTQHLGELGDVARGLAHALRNPLHAIGLSVDELADKAGGEEAAELAEPARRQIRRLDESIRSFLALASGGTGAVETLDAGSLVEDVVLSALQDARGRVRLEVEKPPAPCALRGIAAEVRAVVQALVDNAAEASPDGGLVRVRVLRRDAGCAVMVEDEGPGLAPDVRAHLFEPHVTTKANGSGMGLFLAQRIASTRYGGSVRLEPLEPHGTRATLTLAGREEPRG